MTFRDAELFPLVDRRGPANGLAGSLVQLLGKVLGDGLSPAGFLDDALDRIHTPSYWILIPDTRGRNSKLEIISCGILTR